MPPDDRYNEIRYATNKQKNKSTKNLSDTFISYVIIFSIKNRH